MKKLFEIKLKRSAKAKELRAITDKAVKELRGLTEEEKAAIEELKEVIAELDEVIAEVEANEEVEEEEVKEEVKEEARKKTVRFSPVSKEQKDFRSYDLSKALREQRNGKLTGLEAEMHQEGVKELRGREVNGLVIPRMVMRSFTNATNTGHYSEMQGGIDFVADRGLLSQLGVTVYDNLTNQLKLVFSKGFAAAKLAEGADDSDGTGDEAYGVLAPARYQGHSVVSNEFLATSSTTASLMSDMSASIETAIAKDIITQILAIAGGTLTGRESTADAAALTWADVMALKGAVKSTQFVNPRFVAGGELYANLEATRKDAGSGKMIIEDSKINSYQAIDMGGIMPSHGAAAKLGYDIIFGDFSKAHVGYFGGIEILVDPYTNSGKGQTKLTYVQLGDADVNPYAFKSIQNAKV